MNYLKELAKYLEIRFPTRQFSTDLGYSESTVSQYLNDKQRISEKFIQKLEEVYDINYKEFIKQFQNTVSEPKQSYGKPDTNQETKAIIKELNNLLHRAEEYMDLLKETPPSAQTLEESKKTIKLITEIRKDISEYQNYL